MSRSARRDEKHEPARLGARRVFFPGLLVCVCLGLGFGACATMKPRPVPTGILKVVCNEPEASLWLDDRALGQVGRWAQGGRVPAGFRRITIRHPDYYPFYAEITLEPGATEVIEAELRRQLE